MTELEKIAYAKTFIDKLANGINPIDDTAVLETDVINNVRISRCFFFVSDILRQVCENGGVAKSKPKRISKSPFSATLAQLEKFEYSIKPITVSEISKRLYSLVENNNMKKITYRQITQWLIDVGMLYEEQQENGKITKRPTEAGNQIGILLETRMGKYGEYKIVVYNEEAQRFIVDNIEAVAATEVKNKENEQNEE